MRRSRTTEYFGGKDPLSPGVHLSFQSALEFDDHSVDNIAALVWNGMRGNDPKKEFITKNDMRVWTKKIMEKKHPGIPFSEKMFEKGFARIDVDKDGKITLNDVKIITLAKVKKENLYIGSEPKH